LWWPILTKDLQAEQLLCWSGMTDTEHTTSGTNEEDLGIVIITTYIISYLSQWRSL